MTRPRDYLREELASRVERNGVVVWIDPHGEYSESVDSVIPEGVDLGRLAGSAYALRRSLEGQLSSTDPRLVVYLDAEVDGDDPLEEVRAAGREFRIRLATLLKKTLGHEVPESRLEDIAETASNLTEAETLIEGGAGGGPARLVKLVGTSEPAQIVLELMCREAEQVADGREIEDELRSHLATHFGIDWSGSVEDLAASVARQLALVELREAVGQLPESLASAAPTSTAEHRQRCQKLLYRWRHDDTLRDQFVEAMRAASDDLAVADAGIDWVFDLAELDTLPGYESLALEQYLHLIERADYLEAEDLAAVRLGSLWSAVGEESQWRETWSVAHAIAQLNRVLDAVPKVKGVEQALRDYADRVWRVDAAHRRMEMALISFVQRDQLESVIRDARRAYDNWLDSYLRAFTGHLADDGLVVGDLLRQGQVHPTAVAALSQRGPVAYFMVDALRFELGAALRDRLERVYPTADLDLKPAVALLPSITTVGMANLCPGADDGLRLTLEEGERLNVDVDGQSTMRPQDRVTRLQAAHGKVADLRLDDVSRWNDQELQESISGSDLVLVRSQEIDEIGESGKISASLDMFDLLLDHLRRAVARLSQQGIQRFVITADHGFLSLTRDLGQAMIIPKPGGTGEVHRRAFVGRGGSAGDALVRIPMAKVGLPGDLDVLVPRGLALIAAGGSRGFFHGGASPQELVVPVLTVELEPPKGTTEVSVDATIASKITSQVFLGKVTMHRDLFSEPLEVRVVPVSEDEGDEVGTLVTTDSGDPAEGLVRLSPAEPVSVGFRLSSSLSRGDRVTLQVFDARTDRLLATSKPGTAARNLEVEDEFA